MRAYNPADAWDQHEILAIAQKSRSYPESKILSLVNANDDFYSILMLRRMTEPAIWLCGSKRFATAVDHRGLAAALA